MLDALYEFAFVTVPWWAWLGLAFVCWCIIAWDIFRD